jgi:hypothetical protein
MQPEALRVWEKLLARKDEFPDAEVRERSGREKQIVVGQFCASIETVRNMTSPVEMSVSVGWSVPPLQRSGVDEPFRKPVTLEVSSRPDGIWVRANGDPWTDDEVIDWQVATLREWVESQRKFAEDEVDGVVVSTDI